MISQIVFMDTEFTSFHNPQLISIGFSASTGEEFYAEVPYCLNQCTEFVKSVVLPLLNADLRCSHDDLRVQLMNWLSIIRVQSILTLCYDSKFDEQLFMHVFNGSPPRMS